MICGPGIKADLWCYTRQVSYCHRNLSVHLFVRFLYFPFSKTTRLISSKSGRKHAWAMGIQICSTIGAGPFWGQIKKIWMILQISFSHEPLARMH